MSQLTKQYFENHAVSFDSIYLNQSPFSRWVNRTFRKAVYERFRIAIESSGDVTNKSVLDIGCGSGHYVVEYARRGASRIVGIDISTKMLELSRELATREGFQDHCQFLQVDFLAHEFHEKFNVVLAMGVFDYLPDPQKFLHKMADVSSGLIIASFPGKSRVRMHLRRIRYQLQNCPIFFYTESDVHQIARLAGLRDYRLEFMPHSGTGWVLIGKMV